MPNTNREKRNAWHREYMLQRRIRNNGIIQAAKARPCLDCNIQYPHYVMQFDHVHGVKLFMLGEIGRKSVSLEQIEAEIAKCDIVCANCHSTRTWQRRRANIEKVAGMTP